MSRKKLLNKIVIILAVTLLLVNFGNQSFAQSSEKLVVLETNLGTIVIEFFTQDAPNHVDNFITLTESGFYDETIFHRIIPGFMIQGGDPNTINGEPSTWGTGGPNTSVNAEFNTIKHNRGIVSMARSADPNSAGSQFFIVDKNSNFLDEQYTVFGRIVTEESFQTLDKIISVEIGSSDRPTNPEQVKITKATVVNRSEISNFLTLSEPERTQSSITQSTENQKFESTEYGISVSFPEGWLLQQPNKTQENSPDVIAVGPKIGAVNPVISLTIQQTNQKTMIELILEKIETLRQPVDTGSLKVISQEEITINGNDAFVIDATGFFTSNNEDVNVQFKEVMIYGAEKFYTFAYSNDLDNFDSQLSRFDETVDSFKELSKDDSKNEDSINGSESTEGGGCLIATAAFGSELAPQVQQLRELRDNTILSTESGTAFMSGFNQFYYSFSPVIADLERESPIFKEVVKLTLTPMLSSLSLLNYVDIDSEQDMLGYGISLIILNAGMYFVAPAIIIYKIRK